MKSYADAPLLESDRFRLPSGRALPRAPQQGEVFNLEADFPTKYDPLLPWYPRGVYVFNGAGWLRLSDLPRQRKGCVIGAQDIENDGIVKFGKEPNISDGYQIAAVSIVPTNPYASFSGTASIFVDTSAPGHVWLVAWRGVGKNAVMVGLAMSAMQKGAPTTVSLSFFDMPKSIDQQAYSLRLYSDIQGRFFMNRTAQFTFDGRGSSALIVAENN